MNDVLHYSLTLYRGCVPSTWYVTWKFII